MRHEDESRSVVRPRYGHQHSVPAGYPGLRQEMPVFDLGNFGEESDTDDDGESDSGEGVAPPAAPVERVRDY